MPRERAPGAACGTHRVMLLRGEAFGVLDGVVGAAAAERLGALGGLAVVERRVAERILDVQVCSPAQVGQKSEDWRRR